MNRRLHRSRTDTIVGGVAAGLASYLNTDPALVRIAWAILVPVTAGAALVAYVVAWIVVPESPETVGDISTAAQGPNSEPARSDGRAGIVVGVGLVLIGLWFLLREYLPDFDWSLVWPLVIVGIGVLILVSSMRRRRDR